MSKKALISVSDKTNLEALLAALKEQDYQIISTGGTAKAIKELGYEVQEVAELTAFPEMLGGRVKTLHPKVLAGILARRDNESDLEDLAQHEIEQIDLVVVNLYPFADVISAEKVVFAEAIENIDIGGPTLLRSAAKNYQSITVLSNPDQYQEYIDVLKEADEKKLQALRERNAIEVFKNIAQYDKLIAKFLEEKLLETPIGANYSAQAEKQLPKSISLDLELQSPLRYGENPHQLAGLYSDGLEQDGIAAAKQLHGKEISFNNLLDLEAAWGIVQEYDQDIPCVAIIKHNNPCGVAIAPNAAQAFADALSTDTVSAFGGIVASNVEIDLAAANEMSQLFLEAIVAPSFSADALEVLKSKKNLRLLEAKLQKQKAYDIKKISGGYLVQEPDDFLHDVDQVKTVTEHQVEESQWVDLIFAWKIVKHCKSNAIVAALNGKTIGVGCGQMNRVKAVEDALVNSDIETRGAVLASDAFFPFADNINLAAQNYVSAIIQPGGSIRDKEVIEAANEAGIAMVFTSTRHFRH